MRTLSVIAAILTTPIALGQTVRELAADLHNVRQPTTLAVEAIDDRTRVTLAIDGADYTLALQPLDVRADHFKVVTDAGVRTHEFAPTTVHGSVEGFPTSRVVGGLFNGRLNAVIDLDTDRPSPDTRFYVQPETSATGRGTPHVVVARADHPGLPDFCGVAHHAHTPLTPRAVRTGSTPRVADVSYEVDRALLFDYFAGNPAIAVAEVEAAHAAVNAIYTGDADVQLDISRIKIRGFFDPYGPLTIDAGELLNAFTNDYRETEPDDPYDLAHLLTARETPGILGLAFVGQTCGFVPTGINRWVDDVYTRVAIIAHEMGHNFGCPHCDTDPSCNLMCGDGGCARTSNNFGAFSQSIIIDSTTAGRCIDTGGPDGIPAPYLLDFVTDSQDVSPAIPGHLLRRGDYRAFAPPVTGRALFRPGNVLQTRPIDLDLPAGATAEMTFNIGVQFQSPVSSFLVERFDPVARTWQTIETIPATSLPASSFQTVPVALPQPTDLPNAAFRLRPAPGSVADFIVEDLRVTATEACGPADLAAPFGVIDLADIDAFIAAFVAGDAPADLAPPAGVLDLADIDAFIAAFVAGCP